MESSRARRKSVPGGFSVGRQLRLRGSKIGAKRRELALQSLARVTRETRCLQGLLATLDLRRSVGDEFWQIGAPSLREANLVLREPLDGVVGEAAQPIDRVASKAGLEADLILVDAPGDAYIFESLWERAPARFPVVIGVGVLPSRKIRRVAATRFCPELETIGGRPRERRAKCLITDCEGIGECVIERNVGA